jgi:hypothetical protein
MKTKTSTTPIYDKRLKGEGEIAESILNLLIAAQKKHMSLSPKYEFNTTVFERAERAGQQSSLLWIPNS